MGIQCFSGDKNRKVVHEKNEKYTDEELKGSMMILIENNKFTYLRREELNYSSKVLNRIMTRFYIEKEDLEILWSFFKKINKDYTGFLTIDDLYILLKEKQSNSIIAPYLDRFFVIIDKRFNDKIAFEELISNLISFCLFSIYQVIKFVFDFADKNKLGYITRSDIIQLVSTKRDGEHIYLQNHSVAIMEIAQFTRNDKIFLEEFCELCNRMPFVYFPAIQLQKSFRKYYVNNGFWEEFESKTIDKHKKFLKNKTEQKIKEKIEGYKKKIEKKNLMMQRKDKVVFMHDIRFTRKTSDTNFFLSHKYGKVEKINRVNSCTNINLYCS
jgi:Ca2+-binding EF-hand superfamily protein